MSLFKSPSVVGKLYPGIAEKLGEIDAYEAIFLLSYGLWLAAMLLNSTFFASSISPSILTAFRYVGIGGATLSLFMRNKHWSAEITSLFLLVFLVFITTRTNAPMLLDLVVFVYSGRFIEFRKIASESLLITCLLLLLTVLSSKTGLIENYVSYSFSGGEMRRREYLGFLYALQPAQLMFNITCLVVFLKGERLSIPLALTLLIANLFIYMFADGRLSFYISVVLISFVLLLKCRFVKKVFGRFLSVLSPFFFPACFALCWFATVGYSGNEAMLHKLNLILGNRLELGHRALLQYGTTLFGQNINFIGNGLDLNGKLNYSGAYNYVDCIYVRLPILYGWIFTVLFLFGMTYATMAAVKKRDYALVIVFAAIAVHCVIDDLVIRLQYCTFLFLIASSLVEVTNGPLTARRIGWRRNSNG